MDNNTKKKQLNILRNVMWLYSCGPPKVPTCRTKGNTENTGKKKWVNSVFMMEREHYTAYSRIRSIDGHGSGKKKSPKINNSSRTIYLAGKIAQHTKKIKKTRETLFYAVKAKIIFFWFGLLVSFFVSCCCVYWKFQSMRISVETVKYAKWLNSNQILNKHNSVELSCELQKMFNYQCNEI